MTIKLVLKCLLPLKVMTLARIYDVSIANFVAEKIDYHDRD